jgi:hypothetical protein
MTEAIEARAFEAVSRHARFAELVALTRGVALRAVHARVLTWRPLAESATDEERGTLREEDAATDFGNAWTALEHGPRTGEQNALLRALWAHAVAEKRVDSKEDEDELAARVTWLAAFTPFDATLLLDRALGESGDAFWPALAERLGRLDAGEIESVGRGEAVAAAMALRASASSEATKEIGRLATRIVDPAIKELLRAGDDSPFELRGEIDTPPRHPAITVLLAVTGLLFAWAALRLTARLALAYRRPAEVKITRASVHIHSSTVILGRTVRERDVVLARQGLTRAVREVRYARAAFYAGLFSLGLGSLLGVRTFVDGVRAASPSLLFYGLLVVATGIGLDFILASLGTRAPGKCRVVFVGRDRLAICVGDLDAAKADSALAELARAR